MANTATIGDLALLDTLTDECRLLIDESNGSDTKAALISVLKRYIVDGITPNIDASSGNWLVGDYDTGVVAKGTVSIDNLIDTSSIKAQADLDTAKISLYVKISAESNNALVEKDDGLFIEIDSDHFTDTTMHVTEDDKTAWNSMLTDAKAYTDSVVALLNSLKLSKVDTLPTENIDSSTIYFVPNASSTDQDDYCTEYIYVDGAWERIGATTINISDYYTATEVDTIVNNITPTNYTSDEIDTIIESIWEV